MESGSMMTLLALALAVVGVIVVSKGMAMLAKVLTAPLGTKLIIVGAAAIAIAALLMALGSGMSKRKEDKTVQNPPPYQQPGGNPNPYPGQNGYPNPYPGGQVGYDPNAGYRLPASGPVQFTGMVQLTGQIQGTATSTGDSYSPGPYLSPEKGGQTVALRPAYK